MYDPVMQLNPIDILILSNGPGELVTWVKPTLRALRLQFGDDWQRVRVSVVLSPCPNASGNEMAIAENYAEVGYRARRIFGRFCCGEKLGKIGIGDRTGL
jgi:hypothetical protein